MSNYGLLPHSSHGIPRAAEMEYSSVDECVAVGFRTHTMTQQFKKLLELFVPIKGDLPSKCTSGGAIIIKTG